MPIVRSFFHSVNMYNAQTKQKNPHTVAWRMAVEAKAQCILTAHASTNANKGAKLTSAGWLAS